MEFISHRDSKRLLLYPCHGVVAYIVSCILKNEPRAMHTFYYHNTVSRLSSGLRDAEGLEFEMRRHGYADGGTSSIDCLPS
jgi:hypothetical protein